MKNHINSILTSNHAHARAHMQTLSVPPTTSCNELHFIADPFTPLWWANCVNLTALSCSNFRKLLRFV